MSTLAFGLGFPPGVNVAKPTPGVWFVHRPDPVPVLNIATKPNIYGSIAARWTNVEKIVCFGWGLGLVFARQSYSQQQSGFRPGPGFPGYQQNSGVPGSQPQSGSDTALHSILLRGVSFQSDPQRT